MKLVLTSLISILVLITLSVSGFVLIIPKDKLITVVSSFPVIGPHTGTIANIKNDITDEGAYLVKNTLYAVTSTWRDISGFSLTKRPQKIVIDLEPDWSKESDVNENQPQTPKVISRTNQKQISTHMAPAEEGLPKVAVTDLRKKTPLPPISQTAKGVTEHKIGLTFYKGIDGTLKNFKKAREWFLKAAAKGNAAAQYNLGVMSYVGQGIEQNFSDAAKWFEQAAKQGNTLAQYNLGFLFYEGKGVPKNYSQAFTWIDRAAQLGDKKAIQARPTIKKLLSKEFIQRK